MAAEIRDLPDHEAIVGANDGDHRLLIDQDREPDYLYTNDPDDNGEETAETDPSSDLLAKQHGTSMNRTCTMVSAEEFGKAMVGSAMKKSLVTDSAGWCFSVYSASTRI